MPNTKFDDLPLMLLSYKGYKIATRMRDDVPEAAVFDPRFPRDPALYKTTSVDLAARWIDAYRDGAVWAELDKTPVPPLSADQWADLSQNLRGPPPCSLTSKSLKQ